MNWSLIKCKYPKSYREIKKMYDSSNKTGNENNDSRFVLEKFIESKGMRVKCPLTLNLDKIEKENINK